VLADRSRRGRRFHPGPAAASGELCFTLKLVVHWVHRITRESTLGPGNSAAKRDTSPLGPPPAAVMLYRPADEYTSYVLTQTCSRPQERESTYRLGLGVTPTSGKLHQLETKMTKRQDAKGAKDPPRSQSINSWRTLGALGALGGLVTSFSCNHDPGPLPSDPARLT